MQKEKSPTFCIGFETCLLSKVSGVKETRRLPTKQKKKKKKKEKERKIKNDLFSLYILLLFAPKICFRIMNKKKPLHQYSNAFQKNFFFYSKNKD